MQIKRIMSLNVRKYFIFVQMKGKLERLSTTNTAVDYLDGLHIVRPGQQEVIHERSLQYSSSRHLLV